MKKRLLSIAMSLTMTLTSFSNSTLSNIYADDGNDDLVVEETTNPSDADHPNDQPEIIKPEVGDDPVDDGLDESESDLDEGDVLEDEPAPIDDQADTVIKGFMGQIKWDDDTNGWNELIRPTNAPGNPNELVTLWKTTDGGQPTQIELQSNDPSGANYCKITATEGESIWSYSIGNVSTNEGDTFYVKGPQYGSYKESEQASLKPDQGEENKFNYIVYEPNFKSLTIQKNLVPATETGTFSFTVNVGEANTPYKGAYTIGNNEKSTNNGKIEGVSSESSAVLQIPLGVKYEVTENNTNGYIVKYDANKNGTIGNDGSTTTVKNISNNMKVSMKKNLE